MSRMKNMSLVAIAALCVVLGACASSSPDSAASQLIVEDAHRTPRTMWPGSTLSNTATIIPGPGADSSAGSTASEATTSESTETTSSTAATTEGPTATETAVTETPATTPATETAPAMTETTPATAEATPATTTTTETKTTAQETNSTTTRKRMRKD